MSHSAAWDFDRTGRPMEMRFEPVSRISGSVRPPGDKSISHRALILASMTSGACRLNDLASGRDVSSTVRCLQRLGFEISDEPPGYGSSVTVKGNGWRPAGSADLDAGNSGTTMRLLAGALAGTSGNYRISGDASLSRRPMGRIADPLRLMGAQIGLSPGDRPPLEIEGRRLRGVEYRLPMASAQVKGAVLIAGLQARGRTSVLEPVPSRDHTERLLGWLGAKIGRMDKSVEVFGGEELFEHRGFRMDVPGDISSAAYFLVAGILSPEGRIEVEGTGLNPSRTGLFDILRRMGAQIEIDVAASDPEPSGTVVARSGPLQGIEVSGEVIPGAIDELPLVALAASQAAGTTVIRDAAELRVKESDRIHTLSVALRALGASIEEQPDGWIVRGPTRLKGGHVSPGGDHRIALCLAIAGTIADGPVIVEDWDCTHISYPGFEDDLAAVIP